MKRLIASRILYWYNCNNRILDDEFMQGYAVDIASNPSRLSQYCFLCISEYLEPKTVRRCQNKPVWRHYTSTVPLSAVKDR